MADEQEQQEENSEDAKKSGGPGIVIWLLVLLVSAGAGFAVPFVMSTEPETTAPEIDLQYEMVPEEESVVVPFGDVTVNLDEGRMNRYLRLTIAVVVAKTEEEVTKALEAKTPLLKNWLLSHLADKALDEIRGKAGLNMLRREIRTQFNEILFVDRRSRIYDVLFEQFNVQ